jgi:uncharacterized protein with NAD-binding domain and iron-sulfur cluster
VTGTGTAGRRDLPGEHGFRFFPAFYHHVIDTMQRIHIARAWSRRTSARQLTLASRSRMIGPSHASCVVLRLDRAIGQTHYG